MRVLTAAASELPANLSKSLYGRRSGNTCYGPDGIYTLPRRSCSRPNRGTICKPEAVTERRGDFRCEI